MSKTWHNQIIHWKDTKSWMPLLSKWIRPFLNDKGIRYLQRMGFQDICWDDDVWLDLTQKIISEDVQCIIDKLSYSLSFSNIRAFHACRPENPKTYFEKGILRNNPEILKDTARRIVEEDDNLRFFRKTIEKDITECDFINRDDGRLYVVLDDRGLVNCSGHYLLYGSEWLVSLLGFGAHNALRQRGYPTIIVADIPLRLFHASELEGLSKALIQEWTRNKVNRPDWVPEIDFTFCLRQDVPANLIVDHYHPKFISDPLHHGTRRENEFIFCPVCNDD